MSDKQIVSRSLLFDFEEIESRKTCELELELVNIRSEILKESVEIEHILAQLKDGTF